MGNKETAKTEPASLDKKRANANACSRSQGILVVSEARGADQEFVKAKERPHQWPTASWASTQHDYVQRWLAHTIHELDVTSNVGLSSFKDIVPRSAGPEGLSSGFDFDKSLLGKNYDSNRGGANARDKTRKRMLEYSSESSFLERALPSDPHPEIPETSNMVERIEEQTKSKTRRQRRKIERSDSLVGSAVSLSIKTQVESFKKRKRHKTREDRYEPQRALVDPNPQMKRPEKAEKKQKRKHRYKGPRNNGNELMRQFSSKSVGHDRLTMRPSHTIGLFKNGRASSPGKRRGLPDLAFSEMGFLRRSNQHQVGMEESKSLSKSQEKEKRRSERAHNEISEYFKPDRTLRDEVEEANIQQATYKSVADQKLRRTGSVNVRCLSSHSKSISQSIESSKRPLSGLDRRQSFEQPVAMPHSRRQMVQPIAAPNTDRSLSNRVTSHHTWSESAQSPETSYRHLEMCSQLSTTPESIRQMLNDTGIFANTGINRGIGRTDKTSSGMPAGSRANTKSLKLLTFSNPSSPTTHPRTRSHNKTRGSVDAMDMSVSRNRCRNQGEQIKIMNETSNRSLESAKVIHPVKTSVQHYSRESALRQYLNDDEATLNHLSKAEVSNQDLFRQVIAREADVKQAPVSNTAPLRTDTNKPTTAFAEEPAAKATMTVQQTTELLIHEETNVEATDHSPLLKSGEKGPRGAIDSTKINMPKSPADPRINHRGPLIFSETAISGSSLECRADDMLVPEGAPVTSRAPETVSDLRIDCQCPDYGFNQAGGTEVEENIDSVAYANAFEVLTVRGSRLSGARAAVNASVSRTVFTPITAEPLYNYQIQNMISHELVDQKNEEGGQTDHLLHWFDTSSKVNLREEESELYEGEYELLNDVEDLEEYDALSANEFDTGAFIGDEHNVYQEVAHGASLQQHSYGMAQPISSINQQHIQILGPNADKSFHQYHSTPEPNRQLVREEDSDSHHELYRFWQPYRQY